MCSLILCITEVQKMKWRQALGNKGSNIPLSFIAKKRAESFIQQIFHFYTNYPGLFGALTKFQHKIQLQPVCAVAQTKMGNAGSSARERHKGELAPPPSPGKDSQAFVFDKKPNTKLVFQSSNEEEEPYYTKEKPSLEQDELGAPRQRSATVSEGSTKVDDKILPTVFKWEGGGKQVYISGTFSNWKALPMVKSHGDFVTIIDLPEGEHQYKFLVDGEWKHDPGVRIVDNNMGSKNNLVSVKKSDFEVFQALAMDSESAGHHQQSEYSQEIPANKPWEKVSGPPILPPHLLQVILNKDTPLSCEPTLLPEPNHVMLNHLYALSIKDGVMVLSATHRYRKKYVTTLLYKPI